MGHLIFYWFAIYFHQPCSFCPRQRSHCPTPTNSRTCWTKVLWLNQCNRTQTEAEYGAIQSANFAGHWQRRSGGDSPPNQEEWRGTSPQSPLVIRIIQINRFIHLGTENSYVYPLAKPFVNFITYIHRMWYKGDSLGNAAEDILYDPEPSLSVLGLPGPIICEVRLRVDWGRIVVHVLWVVFYRMC